MPIVNMDRTIYEEKVYLKQTVMLTLIESVGPAFRLIVVLYFVFLMGAQKRKGAPKHALS